VTVTGQIHGARSSSGSLTSRTLASPITSVAVIWVTTALAAAASPDMVSGSEQEHLPLVGLTIWLWTLTSTGYVLLAVRGTGSSAFTLGVVATWTAVVLVALLGPVMVTGSDPTRIPLAALLAPAAGTLATGFLAIHEAGRPAAGRPEAARLEGGRPEVSAGPAPAARPSTVHGRHSGSG
jgi:hypothetical protein